ncbi:MAG: PilN domain-containing protein, partial [candidate division Zixibacteria bacterium]|nr:PilN domain-containing protein [candidate division Zixibacteria bacterium]
LGDVYKRQPAPAGQAGQPNAAPATTTPSVPKVMPVEVEGYAFTLNALASFMINTMRSDYFEEVELVSTKETQLGEYRAYNFVLSAQLHYLSEEELQGLVAQAEAEQTEQAAPARHKSLN